MIVSALDTKTFSNSILDLFQLFLGQIFHPISLFFETIGRLHVLIPWFRVGWWQQKTLNVATLSTLVFFKSRTITKKCY